MTEHASNELLPSPFLCVIDFARAKSLGVSTFTSELVALRFGVDTYIMIFWIQTCRSIQRLLLPNKNAVLGIISSC